MRNEILECKLRYLKEWQRDGAHMLCPRCGLNRMYKSVHTNALSRIADVYVCPQCGTDEAILDLLRKPLPLHEWAFAVPQRMDDHFIQTPADEVWEQLQRDQIPELMRLFKRYMDASSDSGHDSYRKAAFASCPGLELLMFKPFYARYEAADGQLVVRFMSGDEGIVVTHDVLLLE